MKMTYFLLVIFFAFFVVDVFVCFVVVVFGCFGGCLFVFVCLFCLFVFVGGFLCACACARVCVESIVKTNIKKNEPQPSLTIIVFVFFLF